jgi:poly(A) polymerase
MEEGIFQFDFSLLKGEGITEDLLKRDCTLNAIALPLDKFGTDDFLNYLIDPLGGMKDLNERRIRFIKEQNLIEDPLRVLRGFSLACQLDFEIEEVTLSLLQKHAQLLKEEAGERISEELFKMFAEKASWKFFKLMNEVRVLDSIFPHWDELRQPPHGPYHHLPIDEHSVESLKMLEILLEELKDWKELNEYLDEEIRGKRARRQILKLATLLHDIGKPKAYFVDEDGKMKFTGHEKVGANMIRKEIGPRLKLSRAEIKVLYNMVYYHLRPGFLVECIHTSKRAVFRYFRDTEEEALSIMLLSIADKKATRGQLTTEEDIREHEQILLGLIRKYFEEKEQIKPPRLINGNDVMEILEIPPSPLVGKILKEVQEKQALGQIKTREEAIDYLKRLKEQIEHA